MIKGISTLIFTIAIQCILHCQERSVESFVQDQIAGLNGETIRVNGLLEGVMPFELLYSPHDTICNGVIRYGSDDMIHLEGTCSDSSITLYEFDDYARVSGVIAGNISEKMYDLTWSNHDHSVRYYISAKEGGPLKKEIHVYQVKDEPTYDHLLLWKDYNKIYLSEDKSSILQWMEFECPHAPYACNINVNKEQQKSLSISDQKVSVGSRLFQHSELVQLRDESKHAFSYFYNFRYPHFNHKKIDKFIESTIQEYLSSFENDLNLSNVNDELMIEERLEDRALGDFFLTLVSPDLISGYLTFYSSRQPGIQTTPFVYNRQKNSFVDLNKIWDRDFDFSFFLNKNIANRKRELIKNEDPVIKKVLKKDSFENFVISSKGLVFFTKYSYVYGRRQIIIPFDEVDKYISEKSITNLLK